MDGIIEMFKIDKQFFLRFTVTHHTGFIVDIIGGILGKARRDDQTKPDEERKTNRKPVKSFHIWKVKLKS